MSQTKVPIQNQNSKNFRSKCTRDQQPSMLRTATLGSKQDWGVDLPLKRRLAKRERTGTQGYFSPHLWRQNKTKQNNQPNRRRCKYSQRWLVWFCRSSKSYWVNKEEEFPIAYHLQILDYGDKISKLCLSLVSRTWTRMHSFSLETTSQIASLHWRNLKSENPSSPSVASERPPPLLRRLSALPEVLPPPCPPVTFSSFFPPVFLPFLFSK